MRHICTLGAVAFITSSCTGLPELPTETAFELNFVVQNIRCELLTAMNSVRFVKEEAGWNSGLDLTVQVNNTAKGTANANLGVPLMPGNFVPSLVVARTGTADRTVVLGFKQDFKKDLLKPSKFDCENDRDERGVRLSSNLGIAEWLVNIQEVMDEQKLRDQNFSPKTAGTTIKFIIAANGTAGTNFSLIPIGKNTLGAGATLEASRTATHTLMVTLTKNPTSEPFVNVVIVGDKRSKQGAPGLTTTKEPPPSAATRETNDRVNDAARLQQLLQDKLDQ